MEQTDDPLISSLSFRVVIDDGFAVVRESITTGRKSLFTTYPFQPGEVLCPFSAREILSEPSYLTVQIGVRQHITLQPEFLQYMNHSCAPNVFFDTQAMQVVCLEAIKPGDELAFFYPSTEWDMAQPFVCECGRPNCLQYISGAAHLPPDILQRYRLTDFIRQQMSHRKRLPA